MSGNSTLSPLDQGLIAGIPASFAYNYSALSAAVLFFYDYFLTFPLELQYIWQGRINIGKILFVVNRYSSLISMCGLILDCFVQPATNLECRAFYYIYQTSTIFITLAITSIFILRTYAIYGRKRTVFFLVAIPGYIIVNVASSILSLTGLLLQIVQLRFLSSSSSDRGGVLVTSSSPLRTTPVRLASLPASSSHHRLATLVVDFSNAVFDLLIMILTVFRTGRLAMQSREVSTSNSLSYVLLRDGVLYYSAIFIPQFGLVVLNVIVLKLNSVNLSNVTGGLDNIIDALQVVLVNRLVLNLSHSVNAREDSEFRTRTGLEPPTFATGSFLGNIGGPVRTLPDDLDDEWPEGSENPDHADDNGEISFVRDESELNIECSDPNTQLHAGAKIEEITV